ncbi:hypothetical protein Trco_008306 [Trichoderma cornu-damae]|uniref:Uncharacterized protein n=1 Tax=Trichoderma cornu-damae TaxID=654480 RepID=A0A9P8TRD5_9HYPO|nr:hypothetical protein Trco_008306 [Trichoderma cornu-damae]
MAMGTGYGVEVAMTFHGKIKLAVCSFKPCLIRFSGVAGLHSRDFSGQIKVVVRILWRMLWKTWV